MPNLAVYSASCDVGTPVNVPRAHLDSIAVLRFDEPASGDRYEPLQCRAGMPFTNPTHGQDIEPNRLHGSGKPTHPHRSRIPADAPQQKAAQPPLIDGRTA